MKSNKMGEVKLKELDKLIKEKEFIFESMYDGISIIDKRGIITYVNEANTRITGKDKSYYLGKHVSVIVPDSGMPGVLESGEKLIGITTHVFDATVISNIVPIISNEKIIGVISIFRDLTEIRKLYAKLEYANTTIEHLNERLQLIDKEKGDLVLGHSSVMKEAFRLALKAAAVDSNLLIEGESGTGKEIMAKFIHKNSDRRDKPFIAVNCASIPLNLLESELFGYEEGAFTGARKGGRPGLFEVASGGTLLLDEIGDMDMMLQSKLLRVIQSKEIMRVGGSKIIPVDVRIMSATHKTLQKQVEENKFREDLYYRVMVIKIIIPPLRERKEDISDYIDYIMKRLCAKMKKDISIAEEAVKMLHRYSYPGNIRELENILERAVVMDEDGIINKKDLPFYMLDALKKRETELQLNYHEYFPTIDEVEVDLLKNAIEKFKSKTKIAEVLNISRTTLYRKLEKYNLIEKLDE